MSHSSEQRWPDKACFIRLLVRTGSTEVNLELDYIRSVPHQGEMRFRFNRDFSGLDCDRIYIHIGEKPQFEIEANTEISVNHRGPPDAVSKMDFD